MDYTACALCAHKCLVDRTQGELGRCRMTSEMRVGRIGLHPWEEPPISGERGSGTVFFVGCSLGCVYCQNRKISRGEAETYAARYSAVAGQSEHQTGLAVDMYNTGTADVSFGETEAYQWLSTHAHQYGFILRYPADKTEITGYDFEPWHYRYVGRYHATQMYEQDLCLEEYLAKLNG